MKAIYAKLNAVQAALKAPKSQFNKFGGYSYRKAEDILEAVKPLLLQHACILTCEDEIFFLEGRFYVKATATITAMEDGSSVSTTAYAREEDEKKGMDGSQVTGASSSYARKYALNGLLCIDDTADSDTTNVGDGKTAPAQTSTKKPGRKAAPAASAPAAQPKAGTSPLPERGSEEWQKWVVAIATGWKSSKTGKSAVQVFQTTYAATEDVMSDVLANLEEDAFDYRLTHKDDPAVQAQA